MGKIDSGIYRENNVKQYCDGIRTSKEIALLACENHKYVQRTMLKYNMPRRAIGSAFGTLNGSYKFGKKIDLDGYVLVSAPENHPYARHRKNRNTGLILEHRLTMENKLGRYLLVSEIVDHIDGLRLHNSPSNLRLFQNNANHLKDTITGYKPLFSNQGLLKLKIPALTRKYFEPVHTYRDMKKSGDARLIQILLAALKLGINSPFLLGTHRLLSKAGISDFSDSSLILALAEIYRKYA